MTSNLSWLLKKALEPAMVQGAVVCAPRSNYSYHFHLARNLVPASLANWQVTNSVDDILKILAGSMLAVTTFSVVVIAAAYSSASGVTPRVTQLLMTDTTTHNMLSIFIGSFVFSLVGIISLRISIYDHKGKILLLFVTLRITVGIIVSLIH